MNRALTTKHGGFRGFTSELAGRLRSLAGVAGKTLNVFGTAAMGFHLYVELAEQDRMHKAGYVLVPTVPGCVGICESRWVQRDSPEHWAARNPVY